MSKVGEFYKQVYKLEISLPPVTENGRCSRWQGGGVDTEHVVAPLAGFG